MSAIKRFRASVNFGYIEVAGVTPNLIPYAIEVPATWANVLLLRKYSRYAMGPYQRSIRKAAKARVR